MAANEKETVSTRVSTRNLSELGKLEWLNSKKPVAASMLFLSLLRDTKIFIPYLNLCLPSIITNPTYIPEVEFKALINANDAEALDKSIAVMKLIALYKRRNPDFNKDNLGDIFPETGGQEEVCRVRHGTNRRRC